MIKCILNTFFSLNAQNLFNIRIFNEMSLANNYLKEFLMFV